MNVYYEKRKNLELFKRLEDSTTLHLSKTQNYIPIYNKFFSLNETNYNSINLNHKWYITNIHKPLEEEHEQDEEKEEEEEDEETANIEDNFFIYDCRIKNVTNNKSKEQTIFFKIAPLLDPYRYLIGKYNIEDNNLFNLPQLNSTDKECHPKFIDPNNAAYVDGFFLYLSSHLTQSHHFPHGLDYYGSFLAIKNDFTINVFDDIDYLTMSEFFNKNQNVLFKIDNYDYLCQSDKKQNPIKIDHNISAKSQLSVKSVNNELFENIFEEEDKKNIVNLDELKELEVGLEDITNTNTNTFCNKEDDSKDTNSEKKLKMSLQSGSTCSSRTSHTNDDREKEEDGDKLECDDDDGDEQECDNEDTEDKQEDDAVEEHDDDEEEIINVTIPQFPVQVICMEYCENTFDELILNNKLTTDEWLSAFMQIIMILITYQKAFHFTHNDLHTNNVMYNHTERKFIYYCYNNKYYKVPTYGRIYKIIDFGRSIYKYDGKIFCSDSFQNGGDAATQYNTEPYLNDKKPRLDPNYSFDLCRLACSIFDYIIDDMEEAKSIDKEKEPIKNLILEWCLDDKGVNMLYKNNGDDRYPEFKLYKMISRCVHNHTPQQQLDRPEFDKFSNFKGHVGNEVINIDNIPSYV
jgi:hypothetical protein